MLENLLRRTAARYAARGFRVFGDLEGRERAPEGWRGPLPDLYVEGGTERIAFFSHATKPYLTEADRDEMLAALANPGVALCLIAPDESARRAAELLVHNLPGRPLHRFRLFIPPWIQSFPGPPGPEVP